MDEDRCVGALLGLALGDALGARHEGGFLERLVWRAIGRTRRGELRWTDDTQMAIDLAESVLERGGVDPDALAVSFARSYRWSRGYGPGARKTLLLIRRGVDWRVASRRVFRDGSYGNGAAMRAPVLGLLELDDEALVRAVEGASLVTHAHPLAVEGAALIALAVREAARGASPERRLEACLRLATERAFRDKLERARELLGEASPSYAALRRELGNGVAALDSCVTAIYAASRFDAESVLGMHAWTAGLRGDVDTIGAMSGAIHGAANGAASLPAALVEKIEASAVIAALARRLARAARGSPPGAAAGQRGPSSGAGFAQ